MKITGKIFASLLSILLILVVIAFLDITTIQHLESDISRYRELALQTNSSGRVQANMLTARLAAKNYTIDATDEHILVVEERLELTNEMIDELDTLVHDPEKTKILESLKLELLTYKQLFDRVVDLQGTRNNLVLEGLDVMGPEIERQYTEIMNQAIVKGQTDVSIVAGKLLRNLLLTRLYIAKFLVNNDDSSFQRASVEHSLFIQERNNLQALIGGEDKLRLVENAENLEQNYYEVFLKVHDVINKRNDIINNQLDLIGPMVASNIEVLKLEFKSEQDLIGPNMIQDIEDEIFNSLLLAFIAIFTGLTVTIVVGRHITNPINAITAAMEKIANDNLNEAVPFLDRADEIGQMANALQIFQQNAVKVKTNSTELFSALQSAETVSEFCREAVNRLTKLLNGGHGAFYISEQDNSLTLKGSYGFQHRKYLSSSFDLGQGVAGQAALEKQILLIENVPEDYVMISSGLGAAKPSVIIAIPVIHKDSLLGVIEIASFSKFEESVHKMLDSLMPILALNMENLIRSERTELLLKTTQEQASALEESETELKASEEEMQATNEELIEKTNMLENNAQALQASEEEARVANEELMEKTSVLQFQQKELKESSRYKSEFLANMSHELRTPLNSLLILSKSLADNLDNDLNDENVEAASIIHSSGNQLLNLINDILDLSKIEAGKMDIHVEDRDIKDLGLLLNRKFNHMARTKGIELNINYDDSLPGSFKTDHPKVDQIITNLVGNAIKFTEVGSVTVNFMCTKIENRNRISVAVTDTGIGIEPEQLKQVFGAFRQGDGTTSRKFGGTGLGLSISKNLAEILNGSISVTSKPGEGSCFVLEFEELENTSNGDDKSAPELPIEPTASANISAGEINQLIDDDRTWVVNEKDCILVIEDDLISASSLRDHIQAKGIHCIHAGTGKEGILAAELYNPSGILLDLGLPDMTGWSVLHKLKNNIKTKLIPVHIITASDFDTSRDNEDTIGYLQKPAAPDAVFAMIDKVVDLSASAQNPRILLVEDDDGSIVAITRIFSDILLEIDVVGTGKDALAKIESENYQCVILDLNLPDMHGQEVLSRMSENCVNAGTEMPPVVVYSGQDLEEDETMAIRQYSDSIVIKGSRSFERLKDEVSLFLHSINKRKIVGSAQAVATGITNSSIHAVLKGKVILVVDDDMRNTFAISKILRIQGVNVLMAQDGLKAISQLEVADNIDAVLMDIMMPGMDGYETIIEIRKNPLFMTLPIIALTAKAMKEDKEKCIAVGATDYISKPVDVDKLLLKLAMLLE